jgi:predicted TIM-barrel fold metal-dependent hydrolase
MLDPLAPDAAGRAERALEAGLQGICLFPAMHGYSVHDERLRPVFELAASRPGVVVFVHCGVLTVGVRKKLGLPSRFDLRYSNPIDLHGVALRYPQLNFVIPHFGAGYFREALMVCDLCPNVFLDTSSSNSWIRYQAPRIDLGAVFERALEVAGPRRLLFGTDSSFFPRGWQRAIFDEQVRVLAAAGVSPEDVRCILGDSLARLLAR